MANAIFGGSSAMIWNGSNAITTDLLENTANASSDFWRHINCN